MKNKASFKEKLRYSFDNMMSKGTASMLKMLAVLTLIVVIVTALILFFGDNSGEGSIAAELWDSFYTAVMAELPMSDRGTILRIAVTTVASICGFDTMRKQSATESRTITERKPSA